MHACCAESAAALRPRAGAGVCGKLSAAWCCGWPAVSKEQLQALGKARVVMQFKLKVFPRRVAQQRRMPRRRQRCGSL